MELEISKLLFRVVKGIEAKFNGTIAYGYVDKELGNVICLSDYNIYRSTDFAFVAESWRKIMKAKNQRILFAFCIPSEKELQKLADEENLVLNV